MFPASNQFVSRWIPTQERGIANGVIFAGVGVGAGVTPGLISYIMVHYGWRWSFWASALLGLIAGTAWYFFARDTPEQHASVSAAELEHIQTGRTVKTSSADSSATRPRRCRGAASAPGPRGRAKLTHPPSSWQTACRPALTAVEG